MKIQLTTPEAEKLVQDYFRSSFSPPMVVNGVTIIPESLSLESRTINLMDLVRMARTATPQSKIEKIKTVRQMASEKGCYVGLGDAKQFVEALMPPYAP